MSKRATILLSFIGIIGTMVGASCSHPPSPAPVLATVPVSTLPASIPTEMPLPSPTSTLTRTPVPACPWVVYFYDGETVIPPEDGECLDGLKGIRVFDNLKQISFFVNRSSYLGTYGVCRDISREGDLKFNVTINDSMVSTRFMIMVSPKPIPTSKSSFGFRIQPQFMENNEKGLWVKWIEYASDDFENDKGSLQAIPDWKHNHVWNFDFAFQFSGSQATISMNKKALSREWPLSSSARYLCFAYQMIPTTDNAAELEAQVSFP